MIFLRILAFHSYRKRLKQADRQREKIKLKHVKIGGAPKATKEGKKPIKEKVKQQSNQPTNSEKRDSRGPETVKTTQENQSKQQKLALGWTKQ